MNVLNPRQKEGEETVFNTEIDTEIEIEVKKVGWRVESEKKPDGMHERYDQQDTTDSR